MFVALIVLISGVYAKLQPPQPALTIEMKTYLIRTQVTLSKIYDTVGLMGTNQEHVGPIVDYLLKYRNVDAVLIGSNLKKMRKINYKEQTKNLFCFVNTINDFETTVAFVKATPFFKLNGYTQFIVGKAVTNKTWLIPALEYIWKQRILNYAVIFQIGSTIEVIGYNPFSKALYNFTNHKLGVEIFPDKLDDMFGYKINIGMLHDYPRNKLTNGKLKGQDVKRIEEFCLFSNANLNLTILKNNAEIKEEISLGNIDFSTTRYLNYPNSPFIIHPSYPLSFDYGVILVPTPGLKPSSLYLYNVFEWKVWICLPVTIVVITVVKYIFGKATNFKYGSSFVESIFIIVELFLQLPYDPMNNARSSLKIFFMTWTVFSLLFVTAFNTTLRGSLLTPKYKKGVQHLDDLKDSDLKIIAQTSLYESAEALFEPFKQKLIFTNNTDYLQSNETYKKKSYGYFLTETYLSELAKKKDTSNRYYFQVLPELLVSGHSVYNFPNDSPYITQFHDFMLLDAQHGISKFGIENRVEKVYGLGDEIRMSLNHLQSVFMVFAIGIILSLLVFIFEIVHCKIKSALKRKLLQSVEVI